MTSPLSNLFTVGDYQVDSALNSMTLNGETQVVEPKVMEVLYYLAVRHQQVVSRQQLMDALWPSTVSDGAVSRVVGLLRKALADSPDSPRYIQTIAKKGYRLIASVKDLNTANDQDTIPDRQRVAKTIPLAALSILASLLFGWWILFEPDTPSFQINAPRFEQLTSEKGFEYDASQSSDEKWLVYRHRDNVNQPFHLYLKSRDSQQTVQLTQSEFDDRSPSFSHDNRKIVFFRKGNNTCQLNILNLDEQGQPQAIEQLHQCGAVGHYSNVVWAPDDQSVYFTDRLNSTMPYQVFQLQIKTGKVDEITHRQDNYYGDNELALSPSGNQLLFFRNKYWGNNQVFVKDLLTGSETKITELGFLSWNPSWTPDEQGILFSDNREGGKLNLLTLASGNIETLYQSSQSIHSPELSQSGKQIMYASQSAEVDLWQLSLLSDREGVKAPATKLAINSSRIDSQPVYSKDGKSLLFKSNRSGVMQLWLQTGDDLRVINGLPETIKIDTYAWHPDGVKAVIVSSDKQLYLLDTKNDSFERFGPKNQSAAFPVFSPDGNTLYFTSDSSGDWQLWQYSLESERAVQLTESGGYQVKTGVLGQKLYFTKYRQKGIWQLDLTSQVQRQIVEEVQRSANFHLCADSILYLVEKDNIELWKTSLADTNAATNTVQSEKLMTMARNSRFKFAVTDNCQRLVFSKWDNIESDIMMMNLSER